MLIELLKYFKLITYDIDFNNHIYLGIKSAEGLSAAGGLELHPPYALLRSVAVQPDYQGRGLATIICNALLDRASKCNVHDLYLLTQSASGFFAGIGFKVEDRSKAPALIRNTCQFAQLCPADAVLMKKQLTP